MPEIYSQNDTVRCSGAASVVDGRDEGRSAYQKDYARLLHAPSFRRLQGKTQLFPGHEDDFFRNRLTHSLEVAQIASGVAGRVNTNLRARGATQQVDIDLVEFAALAHDLGHPPFGHNGEAALDGLMLAHGGFEGNAQTLHILAAVEAKRVKLPDGGSSIAHGLDLTYRTLASVLKYDRCIPLGRGQPGLVKGYYQDEADLVRKIKDAVAPGFSDAFKTIECWIMDVADDIAYSSYDYEDSLHARFVTPTKLLDCLFSNGVLRGRVLEKINAALVKVQHRPVENDLELFEHAIRVIGIPSLAVRDEKQFEGLAEDTRKILSDVLRSGTNEKFLSDTISRTAFTAERVGRLIEAIEFDFNTDFPMMSSVRLSRDEMVDVELLKHLNYELVITSHRLAVPEFRGKEIVKGIFDALIESDGRLLQDYWREKYAAADGDSGKHRVVCDFVAGMTDRYAAEMFDAFYGAGKSIFKLH